MREKLAWAGIVGPVVFLLGWSILGTLRKGYSHITDPISELGRVGTSTHTNMTFVFFTFSICMFIFAWPVSHVSKGLAAVLVVHGLVTIGVAMTPLGRYHGDMGHRIFAFCAYVCNILVLVFLYKCRDAFNVASMSIVVPIVGSLLMATCFAISIFVPSRVTGLFQRLGITQGDFWHIVVTVLLLRS